MALIRGRCRLRYLLAREKMRQVDLTERTGYSRQQISNWVNNRELMSWDAGIAVSYVLNCHMEELYEIENIRA
ncbi:helix-turn-helix domain-containing protein [Paenibacillus macquariensis]|uniref:DNA-binding transcriptional regulator, XRE-family HTH domain n=1 Tax=Paenibacillus macquariensis TaxID=948756 RepID=A0ABY1K774_9BACL|nr:helix-turn-helix transcriptional regulator [Paenibacillus macquariensis]MEC0092524.1 helix-turn-helix transcriptional regulator [Paenibacillus macquariensis]OAB35480.1 XRE family transcriptional regulator [Paenibacillus macquariensis subsp. macquariensis]SIR35102.1 DNA-binding transcriptional regulator, XRE-family HTH domain [Paenibacillus macquariensis]